MNTTQATVNYGTMYYIRQFITFFGSYVMVFIIAFGIITNLLSIIIFYVRREKDKVSSQYLGTLAFVDLVNISSFTLPSWLYDNLESLTGLKFDSVMGVQTNLDCQVYAYFWLSFATISSYIIVCFSIERALVIWFPLKMQPIVLSSRPRKIAITTVIVTTLLTSFVVFRTTGIRAMEPDSPHRRQCNWDEHAPYSVQVLHRIMFLLVANGIPCVLIAILNIVLLLGLKCQSMGDRSSDGVKTKAEARIVKNLMLISLFYTIFTSPYIIVWYVYSRAEFGGFVGYTEEDIGTLGRLGYFAGSFIGMNYSCNAIVYVISLDYYSQECKRLFSCGFYDKSKSAKNNSLTQSTGLASSTWR